MTVVAALRKGAVAEPSPLLVARPRDIFQFFERTPMFLALTLASFAAAFGGVGLLWWTMGRDRRYTSIHYLSQNPEEERVPLFGSDPIVVEFEPPEGMRPGQMGLLFDERADTLDVTATIVDLAVRGYLKITELPQTGVARVVRQGRLSARTTQSGRCRAHRVRANRAQRLVRLRVGVAEAVRFAEQLLHGPAKAKKALYSDAVERGWFPRNPNSVRTTWQFVAVAVLLAGIVLTIFLGFQWGAGLARPAGRGGRDAPARRVGRDAAAHGQGTRSDAPRARLCALYPDGRAAPAGVCRAREYLHELPALRDRDEVRGPMGARLQGYRRADRRPPAGTSAARRSTPAASPRTSPVSPRRSRARLRPRRAGRAGAASAAADRRAAAGAAAEAAVGDRERALAMALAVVAVCLILSIAIIVFYNGLVSARQRVREGWSAIDVQLKRRASLIPNLVEAVKGYAAYERGTMEKIAEARGALGTAAGPGAAARADRGADRCAAHDVRRGRGVSGSEGERALRPASARPRGHREQGRVRAQLLQRRGRDLQHPGAKLPEPPPRAHVRISAGGVLRRRRSPQRLMPFFSPCPRS